MIRVIGDRVLVALPPDVDEIVTASGLVLVKDPDRFSTPTRGLVVALGQRAGIVDIDAAVVAVVDVLAEGGRELDVKRALEGLQAAPFEVQLGDCVIFPRSVGELIHDGEIDYVILRESEILGIVEPTKDKA